MINVKKFFSNKKVKTQPVIVYSTLYCPYCIRAKQLLDSKGVKYTEIRVDLDPHLRHEMMEKSKRRTVPQIWIGNTHIGGCTELWTLHNNDELDQLLKQQP